MLIFTNPFSGRSPPFFISCLTRILSHMNLAAYPAMLLPVVHVCVVGIERMPTDTLRFFRPYFFRGWISDLFLSEVLPQFRLIFQTIRLFTFLTVSISGAKHVCILGREFVTSNTFFFPFINSRRAITTEQVFSPRYILQVFRVNTSSIFANMVNVHFSSWFYGGFEISIRKSMRALRLFPIEELPVTMTKPTNPYPTRFCFDNLIEEQLYAFFRIHAQSVLWAGG